MKLEIYEQRSFTESNNCYSQNQQHVEASNCKMDNIQDEETKAVEVVEDDIIQVADNNTQPQLLQEDEEDTENKVFPATEDDDGTGVKGSFSTYQTDLNLTG